MRRKKSLPTKPTEYPSGSCVKTEAGTFLVKAGKRYRIVTDRVLRSWRFPRVIETSEIAVSNYKIAGRLGFRDGTLVLNYGDGRIYIVADNKMRHVTSPDLLERLGADRHSIMSISTDEFKLHQIGVDIS